MLKFPDKEKIDRKYPRRGILVFVLLLLFALTLSSLGIFHVWYHYQIIYIGYKISDESERYQKLQDENRKLKLEFATLTRSTQLENLAQQLGLKTPEHKDIVIIQKAK